MLYAKIKNNEIVKYPYEFTDFQAENPYTTYPDADIEHWFPLTEQAANGYSVVSVSYTAHPTYNSINQAIKESTPVLANGQWRQVWQIVDLSAEEVGANEEIARQANKNQAEEMLLKTDWVEGPSVSDNTKPVYLANLNDIMDYRIALRKIAVNPPITVKSWPAKPDNVWATNE